MGLQRVGHNWATFTYEQIRGAPVFQTVAIFGLPYTSVGKESSCNVRDLGSIPGLGRSPGEGKSYPLQYSGLENSMDCIVHGVAKSQTWLSDFHFHFSSYLSSTDGWMESRLQRLVIVWWRWWWRRVNAGVIYHSSASPSTLLNIRVTFKEGRRPSIK